MDSPPSARLEGREGDSARWAAGSVASTEPWLLPPSAGHPGRGASAFGTLTSFKITSCAKLMFMRDLGAARAWDAQGNVTLIISQDDIRVIII